MAETTRADQLSAIYNHLLGSAGSNSKRDEVMEALARAGAQIPADVLAQQLQRRGSLGGQQDLLATIAGARYAPSRAGSGRSAAQHFQPLEPESQFSVAPGIYDSTGGMSGQVGMDDLAPGQIAFTAAGTGEGVVTPSQNAKRDAELARRRALADEAHMQAAASAYGRMLDSDNPAFQREAREGLGLPVGGEADGAQFDQIGNVMDHLLAGPPPQTPQGAVGQVQQVIAGAPPAIKGEFENAAMPHVRAQMRSAAADWAAISTAMGDPSVDQGQLEDMGQQFLQRHPSFTQFPPQAISKEQAAELQKKIKLAEYGEQMPGVPLDFDEKGNVRVIPGYAEVQRNKATLANTAAAAEARDRTAVYNADMKRSRAVLLPKPGLDVERTSPEYTAYVDSVLRAQAIAEQAHADFTAPAASPATPAPVAPPPPPGPPKSFPNGLAAMRAAQSGNLGEGESFIVNGVRGVVTNGVPVKAD